jgi:hypothetical protein
MHPECPVAITHIATDAGNNTSTGYPEAASPPSALSRHVAPVDDIAGTTATGALHHCSIIRGSCSQYPLKSRPATT